MNNKFILTYGLLAAGILLVVAGIVIIESKKSNAGGATRDKINFHGAKDIEAKIPVSGKTDGQAGEQAANDAPDKYAKTDNSDEKVAILNELALSSNRKILELVYRALEDPSDEVRIAAAQLMDNFDANAIIPAVSKALNDKNEEVRLLAIYALRDADVPETVKLLAKGIGDDSESVRGAVFSTVSVKDTPTKEAILGEAIKSKFQDVKEKSVDLAVEAHSRRTVEMLLGVLNDSDVELKNGIFSIMTVFFSEEFKTCEEARKWWAENKDRFDDELVEK